MLAERVLGVEKQKDQEAVILSGIEAIENFFRRIGMPVSLKELGVEPTDAQILEMAEKCCFPARPAVGIVKKLGKEDIAAIYRMAACP